MDTLDGLLQERLAWLEAGEPLEVCLAGLPPDEATLVRKAALLRSIADTVPTSERIAAQRHELLRLVKENKKMSSQPPTTHKARPRWLLPAALASGAFTLVACVTLFSLLAGLAGLRWFNQPSDVAQNPTPISRGTPAPNTTLAPGSTPDESSPAATAVAREAPDPQSAVLTDVHGIAEVQASDGTWAGASAGHIVKAGQRVRTGALSGATLAFYDGSQARLGPNAEVSVDKLDARKEGGPRVVALTQWVGESDHDVAASSDAASVYEVATPSGTGTAKGTSFHVFVSTTLLVRFDVDEGAVSVTSLNVTVVVVAGQSTVIVSGQPPQEPVFRMTGEGKVERIGASWRIAGRSFLTNENTIIVGHPQVGDWVAFEARILPDGARFADRIVLVARAPENRFEFSGTVGAIGETEWTIAGRVVRVDEQTEIDNNIQVGDQVEVKGGIAQDGMLWAAQISLVEEPELTFKFIGITESITDTVWTISGITVTVDASTQIEAGLAVGDVVVVEGRFLADGSRLAKSIRRVEAAERKFEITGVVESLEPWRVSGVGFETDARTAIDAGIQVGDQVKVEGRIREDGMWVAEKITRLEEEHLPFAFVGVVESIADEVWTISGITITVDANTEIEAGLVVGDIVKVKGRILADGTWLAKSIKRAEEDEREFVIVGPVESMDPWRVAGIGFETDTRTEIDEGIEVGDRVKVEGRILDDGRWVAEEIHLLEEAEPRRFRFTGVVSGINPWVVGGIPLAVDEHTEIEDEIAVGILVRVEGRILPDGTWLAEKIKRLDTQLGCLTLSTVVRSVDAGQIVLLNWQTVKLEGIEVKGEIKVATVVILFGCVSEDGTLIIVNLTVIYQLDAVPVIIIKQPDHDDDDDDDDDDD